MKLLLICLLCFVIGFIEFAIDQWEKLVSVRLKFWPTIAWGAANQYFDLFLNIYFFGMIIAFWETWHSGVHDYMKLIPYAAYMTGRILGTGLSVHLFKLNKKKTDRDRAIKLLEKARHKKKKMGEVIKEDISSDVTIDPIFDSVEAEDIKEEVKERAIEKASAKIAAKIDEAFREEKTKPNAEQQTDNNNAQS